MLAKLTNTYSLESFTSLPSSYQLLSPNRDYNSEFVLNSVRQKPLSPLQRIFPENHNWIQYPSSDTNLPRHRIEPVIQESPTSISNDSNIDTFREDCL